MCILCWRRTREDDTEFIQWSYRYSERVRRHGVLGIERRVRTGVGEAWVRWEGSAGWPEHYSHTWDMFLIPGSLTWRIIPVHILGLLHTWKQDGDNGDIATVSDPEEWRLGIAPATTQGCAQQSPPANGGSTSSVSSASIGMINIV